MRNQLWLLSAFTVAATLSLGAPNADAAKLERASKAKVTSVSYHKAASPRTSIVAKKETANVWSWDEARLTALFIKDADGKYKVEELPDAKNADVKLPIASIAKVMSAAVIFDAIDKKQIALTDMVPVRDETWSFPDSKFAIVGLPKGLKEIPVADALAHTLKLSSNPMIHNLAIYVSGSKENFVALMNKKAKEWGMDDTFFVNESGLPEGTRKEEHTTAKDMLILARHMLPDLERFKEFTHHPLRYWEEAKKPSKKQTAKEEAEEKLHEMGAVIKTGTVNGCQSLLSVTEEAADIQLCAKKGTRFARAIQKLKDIFSLPASGQMMGPERPTERPAIISAVSVSQDRSSEP